MKTSTLKQFKGFTLIELLVVIAIILVLATAGFQAGNFAINRAKKVKALAVCTEMEQAVQRFYDDNGTLPIQIANDTTISSNSGQGRDFLLVLMDQETGTPVLNAKGIKYLNVKQGGSNIDGLIYNTAGTTVTGLYDPWGGDYKIALDGDFDETISVQPKAASSARNLQRRVAAWSDGADGSDPGSTGSTKDDVTTW
jgi:prepilin-type N-terminal cleavage/methylation domain-containing protein